MGEMHESDWSRQILLRSDWLGPSVASMTTTNQNQKFAIFSFIPIRTVFEMEDEYSWEPHTTLANGSSDRTTLPQFKL